MGIKFTSINPTPPPQPPQGPNWSDICNYIGAGGTVVASNVLLRKEQRSARKEQRYLKKQEKKTRQTQYNQLSAEEITPEFFAAERAVAGASRDEIARDLKLWGSKKSRKTSQNNLQLLDDGADKAYYESYGNFDNNYYIEMTPKTSTNPIVRFFKGEKLEYNATIKAKKSVNLTLETNNRKLLVRTCGEQQEITAYQAVTLTQKLTPVSASTKTVNPLPFASMSLKTLPAKECSIDPLAVVVQQGEKTNPAMVITVGHVKTEGGRFEICVSRLNEKGQLLPEPFLKRCLTPGEKLHVSIPGTCLPSTEPGLKYHISIQSYNSSLLFKDITPLSIDWVFVGWLICVLMWNPYKNTGRMVRQCFGLIKKCTRWLVYRVN